MRPRKKSRALDKARKRLAGMVAIDPKLDLGNGISVETYKQAIEETQSSVDGYNKILADSDKAKNNVGVKEEMLDDFSSNVLDAVRIKYGEDSSEYEQVGGTRSSERDRAGSNEEQSDEQNKS